MTVSSILILQILQASRVIPADYWGVINAMLAACGTTQSSQTGAKSFNSTHPKQNITFMHCHWFQANMNITLQGSWRMQLNIEVQGKQVQQVGTPWILKHYPLVQYTKTHITAVEFWLKSNEIYANFKNVNVQ